MDSQLFATHLPIDSCIDGCKDEFEHPDAEDVIIFGDERLRFLLFLQPRL